MNKQRTVHSSHEDLGEFAKVACQVDFYTITDKTTRMRVRNLVTEVDAFVVPDARPLAAQATNLLTVISVLNDHSIRYFLVPGFNDRGSTIALEEDDRHAFANALRALSPGPLLTQVLPKPPVSRANMATSDTQAIHAMRDGRVVRVWWPQTDTSGAIVFGPSYAVDVEFWAPDEWREGVYTHSQMSDHDRNDRLVAPRANRATRVVDRQAVLQTEDIGVYARLSGNRELGARATTHPNLLQPLPDQVRFPIDVVYTWVDSSDPNWQMKRASLTGEPAHREAASQARFMSRDELRFSIRSLYANAPWVNHVYIITDSQRPAWLVDAPGVTVVDHQEIFDDASLLPVFNSHAIEANLQNIPGLNEHFIYFNDDMFIGRPVSPQIFFHQNGIAKHFPSPSRVPFTTNPAWDTPVDAATKNVRRHMEILFGTTVSQVMEHAPYALRKSTLKEMADRLPQAFQNTSAAKMRSTADINIPSNFAHHYGYQVGVSLPSSMNFGYVTVSARDLSTRLDRLLSRRDRDAFCLNDSFSEAEDIESQIAVVTPFFEAYYPVASPWEAR